MNIFKRRFLTTGFTGGGLILHDLPQRFSAPVAISGKFTAPAYIDSRPYCIEASNQGAEPACAGFSVAGLKEMAHWRATGEARQFDGSLCYREAKNLDGAPRQAGTTLWHALRASMVLGWFPDSPVLSIRTPEELRFALHRHGAVVGGFMIDDGWNQVNRVTGYVRDTPGARSLGGHAVLVCYYDRDGVGFQNSWGRGWGAGGNGFGRMTWAQFKRQFHSAAVFSADQEEGIRICQTLT